MGIEHQVVQVNQYELAGTPEAYVAAIRRLAARTEQEGHSGVLQYRFHVNPSSRSAGAMILYADADAWRLHHELAYEWAEMGELQSTVRLKRLILFGPLTSEVESWLTGSGISYDHYPEAAAQFTRT